MIFDWEENSKQVLKNGHYSQNDRWEKKSEYKQQKELISYLMSCGMDKEDIKRVWKSIPSDFLECAVDDKDIDRYFERLYNSTLSWCKKNNHQKKDIEIIVYKEEIDFLNNLGKSYEFRKYLLVLLAIWKYIKEEQGKCFLNSSLRGYAFELACPGKKYRNYTENFVQLNTKYGRIISVGWNFSKGTILTFAKEEGKVLFKIKHPEDIKNFLSVIEHPKAICPICGKEFEVTTKTKRECCEECWRKKEKERIREATKNWRIKCDGEKTQNS